MRVLKQCPLPEVMNKILSKFPFQEKVVWLDYLEQGKFCFAPHDVSQFAHELYLFLTKIVKENPPLGRFKRLFKCRRVTCFKVTENGKPSDPELALERFIIVSNPNNLNSNNFFNQIAIDGRERIDIIIEESAKECVFVELKQWGSVDNPLYSITESLKNLTKYRNIDGEIKIFDKIDLMILAPKAYYCEYGLIDGGKKEQSIEVLDKLLDYLSNEFQTNISLWYLEIKEEVFFDKCHDMYDSYGDKKKQKVCLPEKEKDTFPALARSHWTQLAGVG